MSQSRTIAASHSGPYSLVDIGGDGLAQSPRVVEAGSNANPRYLPARSRSGTPTAWCGQPSGLVGRGTGDDMDSLHAALARSPQSRRDKRPGTRRGIPRQRRREGSQGGPSAGAPRPSVGRGLRQVGFRRECANVGASGGAPQGGGRRGRRRRGPGPTFLPAESRRQWRNQATAASLVPGEDVFKGDANIHTGPARVAIRRGTTDDHWRPSTSGSGLRGSPRRAITTWSPACRVLHAAAVRSSSSNDPLLTNLTGPRPIWERPGPEPSQRHRTH